MDALIKVLGLFLIALGCCLLAILLVWLTRDLF